MATVVTVLVIGADQVTKRLAVKFIPHHSFEFAPFVDLRVTHNPGAAFSFLSEAGGWQRWFLTALSLGVSMVLAVWISRLRVDERLTALALALVLGGAIGNLVDRVIYGHVIDFIDFYYPSAGGCIPLFYGPVNGACHFPTFNIADSAITVGAGLLIAASFPASRRGGNG
jgi:signal peptidase II